MRKRPLVLLSLAGLFEVLTVQATVAAPIAPPAVLAVAPHGRPLEQVYYYHGRNYPYHYNNRYYAHQVYRHNHWHYY
jgi:hypothetical protein